MIGENVVTLVYRRYSKAVSERFLLASIVLASFLFVPPPINEHVSVYMASARWVQKYALSWEEAVAAVSAKMSMK